MSRGARSAVPGSLDGPRRSRGARERSVGPLHPADEEPGRDDPSQSGRQEEGELHPLRRLRDAARADHGRKRRIDGKQEKQHDRADTACGSARASRRSSAAWLDASPLQAPRGSKIAPREQAQARKLRQAGRGPELSSRAPAAIRPPCLPRPSLPAQGRRPRYRRATRGRSALARRARSAHRRHDPCRRHDEAHRFRPLHHRVETDRRRDPASVGVRLERSLHGLQDDTGIYRAQARHEPRRIQDHLLVGVGAPLPRAADRICLPRSLRRVLDRAATFRGRCFPGSSACSFSAAFRAHSAGTW